MSDKLHPQTISVVQTRTDSLGLEVVLGDLNTADFSKRDYSAVLFQYPNTDGTIEDYSELVEKAHSNGVSTLSLKKCDYKLYILYMNHEM